METFLFTSKTKQNDIKPNPNVGTVKFTGGCHVKTIANIGELFANITSVKFASLTKVRQIKTKFPESLREIWFDFTENSIDFTGSSFSPDTTITFRFTNITNFRSMNSILPLVTDSRVEVSFLPHATPPSDVDTFTNKEYDHILACIIQSQTKRGGAFEGYSIDDFENSNTYRALWICQNFDIGFYDFPLGWDWREDYHYKQKSGIIVILTARHLPRVGSKSAIKKIPRELIRRLGLLLIF